MADSRVDIADEQVRFLSGVLVTDTVGFPHPLITQTLGRVRVRLCVAGEDKPGRIPVRDLQGFNSHILIPTTMLKQDGGSVEMCGWAQVLSAVKLSTVQFRYAH